MLEESIVAEVKRLVAAKKLSLKKIADITHVSRGSVSAIASGKRRIKKRKSLREPEIIEETDPWGERFYYPTGPFARCPSCGARVQMPFLACQIEKQADSKNVFPSNLVKSDG